MAGLLQRRPQRTDVTSLPSITSLLCFHGFLFLLQTCIWNCVAFCSGGRVVSTHKGPSTEFQRTRVKANQADRASGEVLGQGITQHIKSGKKIIPWGVWGSRRNEAVGSFDEARGHWADFDAYACEAFEGMAVALPLLLWEGEKHACTPFFFYKR